MNKKVALYIRVSTEEQSKHGYSLDSQRNRLIDYCKDKEYQIIDIYTDEGKSARSKLKNRTELLRLIEDVKLQKFDLIIFWRLDRWFRNIADYYKIQEILEQNNVEWECTDEEYSTTTSNGRLHLNIKLSIAQNESDQTSDRIKFNFENMIKQKKAIIGKNATPLGYTIQGEERNKKVIKDKDKINMVNDMFDFILNTGSIGKLTRYMNSKYNLHIQYNSYKRYLKNTLYYGNYKGIDNYCETYITKEQFDKIQSLITSNVKNNTARDYIFSGLIICPICKRKLSGKFSKGYNVYRCNNHANNGNDFCTFNHQLSESKIEQYILSNFKQELENTIITAEKIIKQENKTYNTIDKSKIKSKLAKLTDLYLDDMIDREKYNKEYTKLTNLLKEPDNKPMKHNLKQYKELLNTNGINIYNKLNNASKRVFWGKYIDHIEIEENEYKIILK